MHFVKDFVRVKKELEEMGFQTDFAQDTYDCFNNPDKKLNEDIDHCEKTDIIRACMKSQEDCDAMLVLNYPKDNVAGYLGAHSLIRIFGLIPRSLLRSEPQRTMGFFIISASTKRKSVLSCRSYSYEAHNSQQRYNKNKRVFVTF